MNQAVEIFLADERTGQLLNTTVPAVVDLAQYVAATGDPVSDQEQYINTDPSAFFDVKKKRYVIAWTAVSTTLTVKPNHFVAVSASSDPTGTWVVRALSPRPPETVRPVCDAGIEVFDYPQVSIAVLSTVTSPQLLPMVLNNLT